MKKRSIYIAKFKTSVSLEEEFWEALKEIAEVKSLTLSGITTRIAADRDPGNLSSAIRVYVLEYYRGMQPSQSALSQVARLHKHAQ